MKLRIEARCKAALASLFITLVSVASSTAQTFTLLKSFGTLTNIAGINPRSQLVHGPDGTLYGTTSDGEGSVRGTVFKMQPDGSGFTVLKWFTNSLDGKSPHAGLTLSGSTLYGTTLWGGSSEYGGTIFKLNTDGTGFTVLKRFTGPDGSAPRGRLTLSGSMLYGTTSWGGSGGWGTVFKVNTDGTGFVTLKEFVENGSDGLFPSGSLTLSGDTLYGTTTGGAFGGGVGVGTVFKINTDGTGYSNLKHLSPLADLILSDGVLYGTTMSGGSSNVGTVFKMNTNGAGYTVLKEFTGSDGANPRADLILSAGVLYGTTYEGGSGGGGTVFKVNTDGTGFSVLKYVFTGLPADGWGPAAGLALVDGVLYGTTERGGGSGVGTVFRMNPDGTGHTMLHDFTLPRDEASPHGGLALSGATLYGTASRGGSSNQGTVFRVNTDGTDYTVLKEFPSFPGDGSEPRGRLTLSGSVLYGTTSWGGSNVGKGTVFKMNTDGTGYQVLKNFRGGDGQNPSGGLALSDSVLYGTTRSGGSFNAGTVFRVNTDGTGHTVLRHFTRSPGDGAFPQAGVTVSGSVLFGTTMNGGGADVGTLFKMNTDSTGFALLKSFADGDGKWPQGLVLSDGVLYGTTDGGGNPGNGTLFKIDADGTGFAVLKHFTGPDGSEPRGHLTLSGSVLYGTTQSGGTAHSGTLFKVNTDGTGYTVLKHFTGSDGAAQQGGLILSSGTLYGTTSEGGSLGLGTVFKLELPGPLLLAARTPGNALILSWSNPNFVLQAAPTVSGTYTNILGATSPYTNAISGPQIFFRLVGNW